MNFARFTEQYKNLSLIEVTIDDRVYRMGQLCLPNEKTMALGIGESRYDINYVFQIMNSIKNTCPSEEVKKLHPESTNLLKIFKYNTEKPNYDFVIIRPAYDQKISEEEYNWLWDLL